MTQTRSLFFADCSLTALYSYCFFLPPRPPHPAAERCRGPDYDETFLFPSPSPDYDVMTSCDARGAASRLCLFFFCFHYEKTTQLSQRFEHPPPHVPLNRTCPLACPSFRNCYCYCGCDPNREERNGTSLGTNLGGSVYDWCGGLNFSHPCYASEDSETACNAVSFVDSPLRPKSGPLRDAGVGVEWMRSSFSYCVKKVGGQMKRSKREHGLPRTNARVTLL